MWLQWFPFFWAAFVVLTDALPNKPYLLYSNLTDVGAIDLRTHVRTDVIDGLHRVIPLDVDSVNNKLYYGEYVYGNISRSDMDGSNRELIVSDVGLIEGLAVDWVGRSIYWTSYTSAKIMVATLDGQHRKILVNTGLEYPRGLAVDPIEGYLFWTDWGSEAAVERSTLSGGDRVVLVNTNITWPNGITLDYTNKRVYWIDAYHDTITSIDYNGGQRTTIFEDVFLDASTFHGFDLDIFNKTIYWSDWRANAIFALDITTPESKIITNISIPTFRFSHGVMGVVIDDQSRQPQGTNPCGSNNGGCQHLCLLEPNARFKCECEIGMKLDQDGKSCIDAFKDEFLMFADADAAKIYQLQTDEINVEPVPIKFVANLSRPVALDFDPVEDRVYWTDVTRRIICRAFRNGSGYEEIVTENVGVADGLTVDLAGRILYWTSTTHNTIEVSRFDGSLRRELINTNLDEPRDIIVDPIGGYMYWTDWGIPKIERAFMDGNNRTELVNTGIYWPNGLTIDHVYGKLYWADAYEDSIEILELETGRRNVIINEKFLIWGFLFRLTTEVNQPFGLTLLHDYIYWTDWRSDTVYRAEINTGAEITPLANKLGKPMDIHAYNVNPKKQYRKIYTFSFPNTGSNFTCIRNRTCPPIDPAPPCPSGYKTSRVNQTCGLYCRNIVGYTWRCPCRNWQECAVRERYFYGCASGYYASYNVRECVQVVKSGRCPYKHKGSLNACINDEACPGTEKCCDSKCTEPASIATHPCQKNNGGCKPGQLCFAVPGGRQCDCGNTLMYNETKQQCEGCPPPQPPANGLLSGKCASTSEIIPYRSPCRVICNKGYKIEVGSHALFMCLPHVFWGSVPKCVVPTDPVFSNCPHNIINGTDPGLATQVVNWIVPTALDHEKNRTIVTVKPSHFMPPMKLGIGVFNIEYRTQDKDFRTTVCSFSITIKDLEPPTFGSTCPQTIIKYVDREENATVTWTEPTATDNVGVDTMHKTNVRSKYPVGVTSVSYEATDAAGLTATCSFTIAIINVCGSTPCGFGAKCVLKNGNSYQCVCGSACPADKTPVCGSDGKDYTNQCHMRLASCSAQKNITVAKQGKCVTADVCSSAPCGFGATCVSENGNKGYKCVCDSTCTKENNPVCGSDNKNYTNQCYMRLASCSAQKNITVVKKGNCADVCSSAPCGFGATCVSENGNKGYKCVCDSTCTKENNPVCGSDNKNYTNQCYMRLASCSAQKNITVVKKGNCADVCSSAPCGFGATCVSENGNKGYKCVCDSTCTKENNPVCGSDNKNYTNQCYMRLASCNARKNITVVKKGDCGCSDLKRNAADNDSSTVDCALVNNNFECKVKCKAGYEAAFAGFLDLVCENKKWIRGNNAGKHVPVNKSPPTCYEKESASNSQCSSGFEILYPNYCIPCPPGSYSQNARCQVCNAGEYQDVKAQTSCKSCKSPKTSLTTGAESCYFNHGSNGVYMVFKAQKSQEYTQDNLRTELANALTDYCSKNNCSFEDNKTRRKRRATGQYKFAKEDIIIVSEQPDVNGRKVEFFILDPNSKELVPTKAFSSENLKTLLLKLLETQKLPSIEVESVIVAKPQASTGGHSSDSKPDAGLIAGLTIGILCLIAGAVGVFIYTRRRKQKNRLESSPVPPVQFSQESGGRVMQIGAPAAPPARSYENPDAIENGVQHGFVNQVYSEVNQPPPYYATTPIRGLATGATALPDQPHVYETPAGAQGEALPAKKPLPGDGVVDLIPPKQGDLSEEKYLRADLPVHYSQNRAQGNVYSLPRDGGPHYENADADGSLKLEPPPKYDDAKLRIIRGQTASSILPNVPRKKDTNDNERGTTTRGRDTVHDLRDVTKEQSES